MLNISRNASFPGHPGPRSIIFGAKLQDGLTTRQFYRKFFPLIPSKLPLTKRYYLYNMLVSRSVGIMPNALDTREIFYSNLLLLGFDPVAMESRAKMPFNRDMFALPNKKAMEFVMYFLFSKLNSKTTHEEFRNCWPVTNKVDEQMFRKACYNWVSRLTKEENDTYFPRVVPSLFHSPGGDKFYNFLLLFSVYVLKVVMHRDHSRHVKIPTFPSKSIHNHAFSQVMSKSLQLQTSLHRKRFLDFTQYSLEVQQHWQSYASELNKENRGLKKRKRDVEKHLQKEVIKKGEQMAKSIAMNNDYQKQVDALQRTQLLQKVRALWKSVDEFSSEHNPQVVESILTNQANQQQLDGTHVDVKIPDLLLREFEQDIHMKRISNTYIGGKLNLISLVQLWNLSLILMKEKIQQDSVPSFDGSSPKMKNNIYIHQGLLSNVESLRSTLAMETIPELKQSVEELKKKIYRDMMVIDGTAPSLQQPSFNLGLGLLPATPPVSFTPAETPASQRITSFQESLKRTPVGVSTPEVINAWTESLKGRRPPATQKAQLSKPTKQIYDKKTTSSQKAGQPTLIPKPRNIQTAKNQHRVGKPREKKHHKTLLKKEISSSAKKHGSAAETYDVISPLALEQRPKVVRTEPCKVVHRNYAGKETATANVADQIIGALSVDKPDSGSSSQSSRSTTPKPQAVDNPLEALDDTAFVSRDLLTRTPAPEKDYSAHHPLVDGVKESDKNIPCPSTAHHQSLHTNTPNDSGGLFEAILSQTKQIPSAKTVKTVLFTSPKEQDYHHYELNFKHDNPPSSSEISSHHNQPLLPPFAFETPKANTEDIDLKQSGFNLLTPFSFITPLSHASSINEKVEKGCTPLNTHEDPERGPNTKTRRISPEIDTLLHFTPTVSIKRGPNTESGGTPTISNLNQHSPTTLQERGPNTETGGTPISNLNQHTPTTLQERGPNTEARETPQRNILIQFSPAPSQATGVDSLAKEHQDAESNSTFNLTQTFEEKLSLAKDPNHTSNVDKLNSPFSNTKTKGQGQLSNSFLGPQIDIFEPTIFNESLNLSDDESRGDNPEPIRSPFGAVEVIDLEVEDQHPPASRDVSSQLNTPGNTTSLKELKECDLMERLKKIKEAQRYDFTYLPPRGGDPPGPPTGIPPGKENTNLQGVSMETMQPGQLQGAQRSQQVKLAADAQMVSGCRGAEGLNVTTEGIANIEPPNNHTYETGPLQSNTSTPTSTISERFLEKSPGKENDSNFIFTLESPGSPGSDPNQITSTNSQSSSEEMSSRRTPEEDSNERDVAPIGVHMGPSAHLESTGPSLLSSSFKNDEMFWLSSNGSNSKGLLTDRRLSYDDFLNESVDTSFLVPGTPYKPGQGSHGATRTPLDDGRANVSPSNAVTIETSTLPVVAQLIEF